MNNQLQQTTRSVPPSPALSIVILTWNEADHIDACLNSLAGQTNQDFEVVVVDAASTDATVRRVRARQSDFPLRLHVETSPHRQPIGEARNLGVRLAKGPRIAFLSADAELDSQWVQRALDGLDEHDMVFGVQSHEPHRWTLGASVRGLRYHFPDAEPDDPLPFASNVASAYRREVLVAFPFEAAANAAEDLLLARRAHDAGYSARYDPGMVVRHHDVADARQELRKNIREGYGWGANHRELGLFLPLIAWGVAALLALVFLVFRPGAVTIVVLAAVLWLPALRRALRRAHHMPAGPLGIGLIATPFFDLVFLFNYLRGLTHPAAPGKTTPPVPETDA